MNTSLKKVNCDYCNILFEKLVYEQKRTKLNFCSHTCHGLYITKKGRSLVRCDECGVQIYKKNREISQRNFCSKSCSATFTNKHKQFGTRRSKLEKYIEQQLNKLYPDLVILYNHKDVIDSELDIYIPSLKLAIELNGIFHYKPVFGVDKLNKIQSNDSKKIRLCVEHNIELLVLDTSHIKYMKESKLRPILKIIQNTINISGR